MSKENGDLIMKMDDETLQRILQEGMDYEADLIMNEVNSDPNIHDAEAPEDIYENMWKEIQGYKDADAKEQEKKAKEEQELISVGKLYKKKRARRKYIVLIAAVVCALGIGTISFGDGKKVFTEMKGLLGNTNHTRVSDGDDDKFDGDIVASEEEAYEEISEKFGFAPVRMHYMPEGMEFVESIIEDDLQNIRIYYDDKKEGMICYNVWPNHRDASLGMDVEDEVINEYLKEVQGVNISIKEYKIKESKDTRWRAEYEYNDVQYYLVLSGIAQDEVEKIIENLYFL